MKVFFQTLGCKVNQYETAAMQRLFAEKGHLATSDIKQADVFVVNTCTVTETGDKKSLRALRRARAENPDCVTVLCGCYAQAFPKAAKLADADIILGTKNRSSVVELVERFFEERERIFAVDGYRADDGFERLQIDGMGSRTRAYIKIEDGCERYCSYCIIPYARGPVRSMPLDEVKKQARALAAVGYREIVITGINLCFYGIHSGFTLGDAVEAVAAVPEIKRIRLSSVEPDMLTDSIIKSLASQKKLCPHFHMSIQSGCNDTLKRMGRLYTVEDYERTAAQLRAALDDPSFTTDIIVGFPGETQEEFDKTVEFVRRFGFFKCHIFPYSKRSGTAAAELPCQVNEAEKKRRARVLTEAAQKSREEILQAQIGKTHTAIAERRRDKGRFDGFTERYVPVLIEREGVSRGDIVTGVATAVEGDCIIIR